MTKIPTMCRYGLTPVVFVAALMAVHPVSAHHSTALFDLQKTVTLKGKVKRFDWVNPHVILWIDVDDASGGKPQTWAIELASPGVLTRNNWTKRTFNPGDTVSIDASPMRDGQHGAFFRKGVTASGQTITFQLQTN